MQLDIYQKKAVEANESKVLCLAAAGSGKTRVLTERIRHLIQDKGVSPEQIVAITFTNMAADEMKKRLEDVKQGMFIGTLHSYANAICTINNIDTSDYINAGTFEKIIDRALALSSNKYPQIEHLLVDEAQDLSPNDYLFTEKCRADNRFFVADDRQSIYQFRGCSDAYIRDMSLNDDFKKYYLTTNYRCAPNIQDFANSLLYSYKALSPNPKSYKTRNGLLERNINLTDALSELEWSENWGSWFILTRTNEELAQIQEMLDKKDIPNITFKKGDLDNEELETVLHSNKVKVLTIHSAKGLESKNVIVCGARMYNYDERRISYVAATRAENALYWCSFMRRKKKKNNATPMKDYFGKSEVDMIKF